MSIAVVTKGPVAMAGAIRNRLKSIGSLELGFALALPNLRTELGAVGNRTYRDRVNQSRVFARCRRK